MGESLRIKRALETAFSGPSWHGPSLMENLREVEESRARAKPLASAHSIWEIVNHLSAWQKAAIAYIDGAAYVTLKDAADWPPVAGSWQSAVSELESSHAALLAKIEQFSDDKIKENVPGADYPWRTLFRGIASHSLYHAGQIGLLKAASK